MCFTVQILEIVSSQGAGKFECSKPVERHQQHRNEKMQTVLTDWSKGFYQLHLYSQYQIPAQHSSSSFLCKVQHLRCYALERETEEILLAGVKQQSSVLLDPKK